MSAAQMAARAQVFLSILFIAGYLAVLGLFLTGNIRTPPEWKDALTLLLGVITGSITTIIAYWFSRQRPNDPDTSK
jgi:tetrahydromethanopterin S-methyltransferase subunit C